MAAIHAHLHSMLRAGVRRMERKVTVDMQTYIQGADCSASGVCVVAGSRSLVPEKMWRRATPCPAITPRVKIALSSYPRKRREKYI